MSTTTQTMSLGSPAAAAPAPERASTTAWIAVSAAMIGAFMAILNIQITNASLLDIEGGIGTGVDNGAWISTSYLIGEIIVIPLTDYLSRVFSFRRYMLVNAVLFPLFSAACAFSHDLGSMILLRGLQGFAGGVLIPMAFTMVLTKLPKAQQPLGLALFALSVTFAPAIGPTIGGYLTENYGWQSIFFVNTPPSIIMLVALWFTLEKKPMQLSLLKEGDWTGIVTMAIGLAALQTVLEEGNKEDWFQSSFIVELAIVAAVFLIAFVAIELTVSKPLVQLRLLKRRNFGIGILVNVLVGIALFGTVYILPQYLGQVQRYNAEQIGFVLAWTGLPQLLIIPFVPLLIKHFDVRYIGFVGISIFAASCFMNTTLSLDSAGDQFFVPNLVRAIGQALVLTPITVITTAGIAPSEAGAASGLSNMLRNLGGAVGTAMLGTILTKREQFHSNIIGQSVTLARDEVRDRIAELTQYFTAHGVTDPGCRPAQGDRRDRRHGPPPGADPGFQRHVRGDWRRAFAGRGRVAVRPQGPGRRRRRRCALSGATDPKVSPIPSCNRFAAADGGFVCPRERCAVEEHVMPAMSLSPTRRELLAATAAAGAISLFPRTLRAAAASDAIRPFTVEHPAGRDRRAAPARGGDALARPRDGRQPVARRTTRQAQAAGRLLGHRLRLAQGRGQPERPAAVHDRDRRPRHPLHPHQVEASERAARHHDPWLAGLRPRIPQGDRPAHRPDRSWRQRRGRFRRGHPVDARLRLLRQADRRRLGTRAYRAGLGRADEAPRIHALRRPGRRLGHTGLQRHGAPVGRRPARHPHQPAGDGTA